MKKIIFLIFMTFMNNSFSQNISSNYSNEMDFFTSILFKLSKFLDIPLFDAMIVLALIIVIVSIPVGLILNKIYGTPMGEVISSGLAAFLVYISTDLIGYTIIATIAVLVTVIFLSKKKD